MKEIDLRSLINDNLICDESDISPYVLVSSMEDNFKERSFGTNREWNQIEQTSYIESILLQRALQPIITFFNYDHTVIVDGYNRYLAISNFFNDKLTLNPKGLKQLKYLSNKHFSNLTNDEEKKYFKTCATLKIIKYSYRKENNIQILNEEKEHEIEKYLHLIYNTGLRLELEEIQKAEYYNDYITKKISEKIKSDKEFLNILETMKMYNGRKIRNKIENILLNCRLLIASTYSNINDFCSTSNISTRIEENYLPNLKNIDQNQVYNDFLLNISYIYKKLIDTPKWNSYPIMHSKPFIEATYWLISVIRKDKLGDPYNFDLMKYLEYFANKEASELNFNANQAHYKKNIYNKYYVVAEYYENKYNVDMSSYFKSPEKQNNQNYTIKSIEDLHRKHFYFTVRKVQLRNLLIELEVGSCNLRPFYQREEIMDEELSSKIIESFLLGIKLPHILIYKKIENGQEITEIVDGQQRLLAIIGFLQKQFMNEKGELEYSNKNGYALKNLRILYEWNDYKSIPSRESKEKEKILPKKLIDKILNTEIYIYQTSESEETNFSAIDHFVRLNKNFFTVKDNTYRMIELIGDNKIIKYEQNITKKYLNTILPRINSKRSSNLITIKLAYLNYLDLKNEKEETKNKLITRNHFSNRNACNWLKNFNKIKDYYMFNNQEKIQQIRELYLQALEEVNKFYFKTNLFLKIQNKTIRDLMQLSQYNTIANTSYYYLYCMLNSISEGDLYNNSEVIYNIIHSFFINIKEDKYNKNKIIEKLNFSIQQITMYDSNKRYSFKEKLNEAINNKI